MYTTSQYPYTDYTHHQPQSIHSIPNPNPNPNPYPHLTYNRTAAYEFDPYANGSSNHGIENDPVAQIAIYRDPFVGLRNGNWVSAQSQPSWVMTQSQPSSAVQYFDPSRSISLAAPASSNYVQKRSRFNQACKKSSSSKILKAVTRSPSIRCQLCNTDCPNLDAYMAHLWGKKHNKNLEAKYAATDMQIRQTSKGMDASTTTLVDSNGADDVVVDHGETLDRKAQKLVEGGASVDSVRICTVCNVACNSEIAFADHLSGKKHSIQAAAMVPLPVTVDANKMYSQKAKKSEAAWCETSNINCQNVEALNGYKLGKQHQKKLVNRKNLNRKSTISNQKISEDPNYSEIGTATPKSTKPINEAKEDMQPSNVKDSKLVRLKKRFPKIDTSEDLETKRSKVVQGGVAEDAIRTCFVCKVVCNSEIVFDNHLAGQRHAAVVRQKQVESENTKVNNNQKVSEKPKNLDTGTSAINLTELITEAKKDPQLSSMNDSKLKKLKKRIPKMDTGENLETKKRKVVQGGVREDAIRTCFVCNVVCNSEIVFNNHLAGQRHAAVARQKPVQSENKTMKE